MKLDKEKTSPSKLSRKGLFAFTTIITVPIIYQILLPETLYYFVPHLSKPCSLLSSTRSDLQGPIN